VTAASDLANVARRALVCLDLTNLDDACDAAAVAELCRRAQTPEGSVAAVCVWPRFVAQAKRELARTGVRVAAVVNFPGGDGAIEAVKAETRAVLGDGADEIDLVTPWRAVRDGDAAAVAATVREVKDVCGEATLKAILETGELEDVALIVLAAEAAIDGGADFLKTSTGKVAAGATPAAAEVMLETIARRGRTVGFKASGGVRTTAEAGVYLALADRIMGPGWAGPRHFRIGASSLLDALLATLAGDDGDDGDGGDGGDY
jgi:deoxyribose-phosphate aldolase